jgi:hypothetical protein
MFQKRLRTTVALSLVVGAPLAALSIAHAAPPVKLCDRAGVEIRQQLDMNDTIMMKDNQGNDVQYAAGPAYSPKGTCGRCHDYDSVTQAYHFMQGAEVGKSPSDHWVEENMHGTAYKYLANAYAHLLGPGQYGAW